MGEMASELGLGGRVRYWKMENGSSVVRHPMGQLVSEPVMCGLVKEFTRD